MNKTEYLNSLRNLLHHLPKEELDKAMEYYEEYFADAGVENEAQAIEDLGSPQTAAESIIKTLVINNAKEPVVTIKKGIKSVWIGLLYICGIPIGLPIALMLIVVLIILILTMFILLMCFYLASVLLVIGGVMAVISSFFGISYGVGVFLTVLGMGFSFLGIGLMIFIGTTKLSKNFLSLLTNLFSKILKKGGKKNE